MEQNSNDEGSGGYHRPWAAAAFLTSALIAPAPARAPPRAGSTGVSARFSRDNTILGVCEELPPPRLEAGPRTMTGAPLSFAQRRVAATSSVDSATTTARGGTTCGS